MELSTALTFAREHRQAVLATQKADGRPQLSNVIYGVDDDGLIRVSITADRAKAKNMARDPRVSLSISRSDFYAYVVLEADAELGPVPTSTDDPAIDEMVDLYRSMAGEHPDWDDYRQAMVRDRRLVARLRPTRAYGMLQLPS
ncbi:MAG TPA: PPOX class F420-dependent oxidoreductase [Acidimicrobiales bacterium]|nr:PPOX class F420-dependent oxidoreductase [Acidimicrobiales bacterium]